VAERRNQRSGKDRSSADKFQKTVASKGKRKIRARRQRDESIWFGLGTFGMVGWSVAIPAVIGIALGAWIDYKRPSPFSWTLMLLFGGVVLGCFNAWYWVSREREKIEQDEEGLEDE